MDIDFLKEIIDEAALFEQQHNSKPDMAAFAGWLQQRHAAVEKRTAAVTSSSQETTESIIGKYLIYLNRYAKSYTKKLLDGTPLTSADEFVFLIYLLNRGAATKSELIEVARLEKPTGMEVIRRLLHLQMIEQGVHESDKRSSKITLTPLGQATLMAVLDRFDQFSMLLTGNLTADEKQQLLHLLQKLEDFHMPLRIRHRHATWHDLIEKSGPR
jgi:MarR family transcriptional regulator, lower aerobic nicotinate degradation pathway regulator